MASEAWGDSRVSGKVFFTFQTAPLLVWCWVLCEGWSAWSCCSHFVTTRDACDNSKHKVSKWMHIKMLVYDESLIPGNELQLRAWCYVRKYIFHFEGQWSHLCQPQHLLLSHSCNQHLVRTHHVGHFVLLEYQCEWMDSCPEGSHCPKGG